MVSAILGLIDKLIFVLLFYGLPMLFVFLLVYTVGLRDRDTKLKIRENGVNILKKLFP